MQWEKADNKPAIALYISGAAFAIFFSEWLIHLPVLNVVRGYCSVIWGSDYIRSCAANAQHALQHSSNKGSVT